MSNSYFPLIIVVIALAINVLVQIFSVRYLKKIGLLNSVFLGFIFGIFTICLIQMCIFFDCGVTAKEIAFVLIECLITYIALGYCYFHFINLGETARRIRILNELKDSVIGLSQDEILIRYNSKDIIARRISRLVKNGQILLKDGKYYIRTSTMFFVAKFLSQLKFVLFGEKI